MNVTDQGDHVMVVISGDMDLDWLARNQATLDDLVASQPKTLVLDLSNVTFLDSTGLGVLARCVKVVKQQHRSDGHVSVIGARDEVRDTIQLVGLDRHMTLDD